MTNEIGRIHVRELSPYPGELAVLLLCYLAVQVLKLWIKSHLVAKRASYNREKLLVLAYVMINVNKTF